MQLMRLRPPPLKPALPPEPQNPLPPRPSRLFCGQAWSIRSPPRIHHSLRLLPPRPLPPKGLSSPRVPSYPPHRQRGCQTINWITALCFNIPDTIKTRTFKTAHAVRGRGSSPATAPPPHHPRARTRAAAPEGAGHQPAQARASGSIHRQSRGAWPAGLGGKVLRALQPVRTSMPRPLTPRQMRPRLAKRGPALAPPARPAPTAELRPGFKESDEMTGAPGPPPGLRATSPPRLSVLS